MSVITLTTYPNTRRKMDVQPVAEISSDDEVTPIEESLSYKYKYGDIEFPSENLKCLNDKQYLSDSIIQFYLAYLHNGCHQELRDQVCFFDSMIIGKLEAAFKDNEKVSPKALKNVHRWNTKREMFDMDYIIFPICSEQHWFVVVVCYPGLVKSFEESYQSDIDQKITDDDVPILFVMDSLACKQKKYTSLIRDFLDYEWRYSSDTIKRFSNYDIPTYHPKLPMQTNSYDCGIYMLAYIKTFLNDPKKFSRYVSDDSSTSHTWLERKIKETLETVSRDSIRSLTRQICESNIR